MDEKRDWQEMEKRLKEYAKKDEIQLQEIQMLKEQLQDFISPNRIKTIDHSGEFWDSIRNNITKNAGPFGSDAVQAMIKSGKMTVHDTDRYGFTLLHIAARRGSYDLAKFLINNVRFVSFARGHNTNATALVLGC